MEEEIKHSKRERRELAREQKRIEREKMQKRSSLKKNLMTLLVLAILGFGGYKLLIWIKNPAVGPGGSNQNDILTLKSDDWKKGSDGAKAVLIEYGDFQCPACAAYSEMTKNLLIELPDDLILIYRHFPLLSIHKNALPAAKASEAAGMQGNFWKMHDLLYSQQTDWSGESDPKPKFEEYAKSLGLDLVKFNSDMEGDEAKNRVDRGIYEAGFLKLNSTPTYFLNGRKIAPRGYDDFKSLIMKAIEAD